MGKSFEIVVRHNTTAKRFEADIEGDLALLDYEIEKHSMVLTHTFVPPPLRGRGIAEALVRAALDYARLEKHSIVPACSYVARFVARHPVYADLLHGNRTAN